ncbi:MAG: MotA/TolQ/ExbB proton channel family protein [Longimicrobiales bacterium]
MAQCPNCGTTAAADQPVCLVCGTELPASAQGAGGSKHAHATTAGTGVRSGEGVVRKPGRPTSGALVPFAAALVAIVVMEVLIDSVAGPGDYVFRLFRPSGGWLMAVVPGLTAFAFFWACADLFLKLRVTRVNEEDLARAEIVRLPAIVAQEPASVTLHRLRGWDGRVLARPVGRRVQWLLQHLETTDSARAHELIRHQSDLEVDAAASGYRVVKLLIWAMPILGFIGTVLGISLAVGGFANFLTTTVSIDDISRVTNELGSVASGLSFAFDTTLVGLVGGLAASVLSTGVQSREEGVLTRLEELGLRMIEGAMPADSKAAPAVAVALPGDEFEKLMRARLQELSKQMDHFTQAVGAGLDGFLTEWAKLPPEVERVAADLSGLRQHLGAAAKSTEQLILETRVLLEGLKESSARMSVGLEASIGTVNSTVEDLGIELQRVADSLSRSVDALGQRISAEEALQRLNVSIHELAGRMNDLSATQASLAPVLNQLAGPLELRLMPASTRSPER